MDAADGLILAITTVSSMDEAQRLAAAVVEPSLAACVQIDGPITSLYRWAGKLEQSSEFRLMIKSSQTAWPQLKERLAREHPYEEPEIIRIPIDDASDGYRQWVIDQTT